MERVDKNKTFRKDGDTSVVNRVDSGLSSGRTEQNLTLRGPLTGESYVTWGVGVSNENDRMESILPECPDTVVDIVSSDSSTTVI